MMTIGVGIGIGVGNIAHYRYFGPTNQTYIYNDSDLNQIAADDILTDITSRQLFPLNEDLKTRHSSPKIREFWLYINKPPDDNQDRP